LPDVWNEICYGIPRADPPLEEMAMLRGLKLSVLIGALLFATPSAHATGKIVVAHDEWALSDWGFYYAPSAQRFALNIAGFFTGGQPGRFLVYSSNWGLTGERLASTMRGAGHEWTVVNPASNPAVDLSPYTAVFVGQTAVDGAALTTYVQNGGHVYVMAGTGHGIADSVSWNDFLNTFGLDLAIDYNGVVGLFPVTPTHPLFEGVSSLVYVAGNDIRATGLMPGGQVIQSVGSHGVFAVYSDDSMLLPMTLKTSLCGDAVYVRKNSKGQLSVNFIGTALSGDAIDPQSVRLLGLPLVKFDVSDRMSLLLSPSATTQCTEHPDGIVDLQVKFDLLKVSQKLWSLLGTKLSDGDVLTVTATGKLKPEYGGIPIRGEARLTIRTR
jgi:hypothetical protein